MKRSSFYIFLTLGGLVLTLSVVTIVFVWLLDVFGSWATYEKMEGNSLVVAIFGLSIVAMLVLVGLPFVLHVIFRWIDWGFAKASSFDEMSW